MSMIARLVAMLVLLLAMGAAQAQNKVPSERALEALVKTSLLSFNDANVTGNYTVLHAKLSKPFREQLSAGAAEGDLQGFQREEHRHRAHGGAASRATSQPPSIDAEGKLVVKGYFPTEPIRVNFNLAFIPSDGEWKLIRLNVKLGAAP